MCYEYTLCVSSGLTAIHVATKESSIDVLKFFFQMGSNKNTPVSMHQYIHFGLCVLHDFVHLLLEWNCFVRCLQVWQE